MDDDIWNATTPIIANDTLPDGGGGGGNDESEYYDDLYNDTHHDDMVVDHLGMVQKKERRSLLLSGSWLKLQLL